MQLAITLFLTVGLLLAIIQAWVRVGVWLGRRIVWSRGKVSGHSAVRDGGPDSCLDS